MSAQEQIGDVVSFIATITAAREEATAEQLDEMKRRLVPQLVTMRVNGSIAGPKAVLAEIMGHDWRPHGELAVSPEAAMTIVEQGMRDRGQDPDAVFAPPK